MEKKMIAIHGSGLLKAVTFAVVLSFAVCRLSVLEAADTAPRANIVFILADDLGFESLGSYGGASYQTSRQRLGPVRTPNLDALARDGMRFLHCFATPVCSPARGEFLTGKYNFRIGLCDICGRNGAVESLDSQAHATLAATLKAAGYVTAVTGKWHLGNWPLDPAVDKATQGIPATQDVDTDCPHVKSCGFQRQFVFAGSRLEEYGPPTPAGYIPARFHNWAMRFLESRRGQPEPFFLYYASPIPHVPWRPTPLNPDGKAGDPSYPYLIEYLDNQVGEIVKKLEELGMRKNTLVMFSGDNGTCNITTQMRDGRLVKFGKGTMLDTGSWVPLVASWPAAMHAGTVYEGLVDFSDIMPTCLDLAGAKTPAGLDGISFAPQLRGEAGKPREWVHVHYVDKYFARESNWKLRENGELYDVSGSPYTEALVDPAQDTVESRAARQRLQAVLNKLHKPIGE